MVTLRYMDMGKKLIFLDIDGVLNSDNWTRRYFRENFHYIAEIDQDLDPRTLNIIDTLVDKTKGEIVLISSWRFDLENTKRRLNFSGLKSKINYSLPIFPLESESGWSRGKLIFEFLKKNKCERYIILDDTDDELSNHGKERFIKIDPVTGITETDMNKAIKLLNE